MKAISIKQPFAELILSGKKEIETRSWRTNFRGKVYIHSSKIPDKEALKRMGLQDKEFKNGFILGHVEIVNCFRFINEFHFNKLKEKHLSPYQYFHTLWGWVVTKPTRIKPIPHKGHLRFFNIRLKCTKS